MKKSRGFTLFELLIVIAIVGILVSLAIPSFQTFFEKNRLRGAAEAVYEQLQYARSLAVKKSTPIIVDFWIAPGDATNWSLGITDNLNVEGCDASITTTVDSDSDGIEDNGGCTINYDNDLLIDHPGITTPSDLVLTRIDGSNNHGIEMKGATGILPLFVGTPGACITTDDQEACFEPIQGLARETNDPAGHIQLESEHYKLQVRVNKSGKIKVCVPPGVGATTFIGYDFCT